MPHHVHLPPLMPFLGPQPLEKKEKLRRKAAIRAEKLDETGEAKADQVEAVEPPPPAPVSHNPSPLSGAAAGGLFSVLLGAQEEAQPVETRPARDPDEDL
jgi:hypothetical protein